MLLLFKIFDFGKTNEEMIIPKSWLQYYENKNGKRIVTVVLELDECRVNSNEEINSLIFFEVEERSETDAFLGKHEKLAKSLTIMYDFSKMILPFIIGLIFWLIFGYEG